MTKFLMSVHWIYLKLLLHPSFFFGYYSSYSSSFFPIIKQIVSMHFYMLNKLKSLLNNHELLIFSETDIFFPLEVEISPILYIISCTKYHNSHCPVPTLTVILFHLPLGHGIFRIYNYHHFNILQRFLSMAQTSVWSGPFPHLWYHINLIVYTPSILDYRCITWNAHVVSFQSPCFKYPHQFPYTSHILSLPTLRRGSSLKNAPLYSVQTCLYYITSKITHLCAPHLWLTQSVCSINVYEKVFSPLFSFKNRTDEFRAQLIC